MLKNVILQNLALIEKAEIEFDAGLNILTGETGAGKSIIISSVNMALGEKANKSMIRRDSDYGYVELLFTGIDEKVSEVLKSYELDSDDGNMIVTRKISEDSSISKINGKNVTLNILKEITSLLVDIHGQHDHQSLLDASKHIVFIDDFGGAEIAAVKNELRDEHSRYRNLRIEYKDYDKTEEELEHEISLNRFELNEIESADIKEGEDVKLEEEYRKLSEYENIRHLIGNAYNIFSDDGAAVKDKISDALKNIEEAHRISADYETLKNSLSDLESIANDISRELDSLVNDSSSDPERRSYVEERLNLINKLKAKYGSGIDKINAYKDELSKKIESYNDYFKTKEELQGRIHLSAERLNKLSIELSEKRKKVISELEPEIKKNLKDLNFEQADFEISMEKNERIGENGFDRVEFLISLNPGEKLMPLSKIASGGEISRIMLAIKSAVANKDETATLIFDEIDTGISGKTANMVAEKLHDLSRSHQIICISHLPQIAAMADSHYGIHKQVEDGNTISGIEKLNEDMMIKEIAKLVGGKEITPAAMENARDLKGHANFYKHKLR